eukprot:NODE_5847_length_672_cov_3.264848_g4946_i0.p2 GENE.NODE_5847_length_672_cov_3.264848_g4946_i0~~NODE_5847_length_672_cov_3.264848_g4946_i0.p2  ORF type:complete len:204 (-),score=94.59 NODE_5847_length_672_cov_3.264848_g4946_i0:60-635(-)
MMDRPSTPLFVQSKTGVDAETQILEGDLFDFDEEVDPFLEVLVGKTLEQAMLEVVQEEELDALRQQQVEYDQRLREEQSETQRLEAAERRKFEEKERRKAQGYQRIERERNTREKLAARRFAKQFLGPLEDQVFGRLEDDGWFHDSVVREVETDFLPWLSRATLRQMTFHRAGHDLVDDLIKDAIASRKSG